MTEETPKRKSNRRIPDSQWLKYVAAIKDNHSQVSAAKIAGISHSTVMQHLKTPDSNLNRLLGATGVKEEAGVFGADKVTDKNALRALNDIGFFRSYYFARSSSPWVEEATEKIVKLLDTPNKEYVVVNICPGIGKSTFFTHDLPIWLAVRDRARRTMIGSRTAGQANKYTGRIRRTLERTTPSKADSELFARGLAQDAKSTLIKDFGRFKPTNSDRWRMEEFYLAQESGDGVEDKEPNFASYGMDSGFLGGRFNTVIWDDLVDRTNTKTAEARENLRELWETAMENRLEPNGLLLLVGQRISSDDLYRYALDQVEFTEEFEEQPEKAPKIYHHIVYKAHYEEKCGRDSKGNPTHKGQYPNGCLIDEYRLPWREIGRLMKNRANRFELTYQQEDVDTVNALVKQEWIDGGTDSHGVFHRGCWDEDRNIGNWPKELNAYSVVTVDPSPTKYWGCVDANALVTTNRGHFPLKYIKVGDKVLTRKGYKEVLESGSKGTKPTLEVNLSNGTILRLTSDHQVFSNESWVEAGKLSLGDSLTVASLIGGSSANPTSPLPLTPPVEVLTTKGMPIVTMGSLDKSPDVVSPPHIFSMILTDKVFWINARRILAKMASLVPFWNRLTIEDKMTDYHSSNNNLIPVLPDGSEGVSSDIFGAIPVPTTTFVGGRAFFYPFNAEFHPLPFGEFTVSATDTPQSLLPNGGVTFDTSTVVSISHGLMIPVWDITVKDEPEFFANGVLVHNCIWWGYNAETKEQHVVDLKRVAMTAPEFLDWDATEKKFTGLLEQWWLRSSDQGHPFQYLIFEENAAQRWLTQFDHFRRWASLRGVHLVKHQTARNKSNEEYGVQMLAPEYEHGRVRFPGKDFLGSKAAMRPMIKELLEWTPDGGGSTSDLVMSHWFLLWNAPTLFDYNQAKPPQFKRPSWLAGRSIR